MTRLRRVWWAVQRPWWRLQSTRVTFSLAMMPVVPKWRRVRRFGSDWGALDFEWGPLIIQAGWDGNASHWRAS